MQIFWNAELTKQTLYEEGPINAIIRLYFFSLRAGI